MPLYFDRPQSPFTVNDTIYDLVQTQLYRPRSLLLSFRGTIKHNSPWYQHRWLASAYWPRDEAQLWVNVRCPHENVTLQSSGGDYTQYVAILTSSTFVFCPGGRSPGSWRFGEALALGAIPVVTNDFLPPFYPEIDWSDCLVQVNQARIVDLPRIVRSFGKEEIRRRQKRCHDLFQSTIGGKGQSIWKELTLWWR